MLQVLLLIQIGSAISAKSTESGRTRWVIYRVSCALLVADIHHLVLHACVRLEGVIRAVVPVDIYVRLVVSPYSQKFNIYGMLQLPKIRCVVRCYY